jgi:predicted ATPase
VATAELTELRLPAFKSVRKAVIPIGALTLIVGRNGSGKSNIIDGLAVLSALVEGGDLRDALDGGRTGPVVRGGSGDVRRWGRRRSSWVAR